MLKFNEIIWRNIVGQWGRYGPQRTALLKNNYVKFVHMRSWRNNYSPMSQLQPSWGNLLEFVSAKFITYGSIEVINFGQWGRYDIQRVPLLKGFLSGCLSHKLFGIKEFTDLMGHLSSIFHCWPLTDSFSYRIYYFYKPDLYKSVGQLWNIIKYSAPEGINNPNYWSMEEFVKGEIKSIQKNWHKQTWKR